MTIPPTTYSSAHNFKITSIYSKMQFNQFRYENRMQTRQYCLIQLRIEGKKRNKKYSKPRSSALTSSTRRSTPKLGPRLDGIMIWSILWRCMSVTCKISEREHLVKLLRTDTWIRNLKHEITVTKKNWNQISISDRTNRKKKFARSKKWQVRTNKQNIFNRRNQHYHLPDAQIVHGTMRLHKANNKLHQLC